MVICVRLLIQVILIQKDISARLSFHVKNSNVAGNAMPNGLALDCPNGVLTHLQHGKRSKKLRQYIVEELVAAVVRVGVCGVV